MNSNRYQAELALCKAVHRGDRSSAEKLAKRLLPHVRRATHSLISNTSDAEDSSQNALLEILRSSANYSGRGSLEAWAHRIAVRIALRRARQQRRQRKFEVAEVERGEVIHQDSPIVHAESIPRPLWEYLNNLSDVQRSAFILRHALGHTIAEIAELTSSPIPTVKSRLSKAQLELRRWIRRDLQIHETKLPSPIERSRTIPAKQSRQS